MYWVNIWNAIYWRCHHLSIDIFSVPGNFLGLDYIHMTKNQRLTFSIAKIHGSKGQKFNFWPTLSAYILVCQYLPVDFYCLSESPPYALSKTIKVPMGYYCHFLLWGSKLLIFKKICCFKKSMMANALYLHNVGQHLTWCLHPQVRSPEIIPVGFWAKFKKIMFRYYLNLHIISLKSLSLKFVKHSSWLWFTFCKKKNF